MLCVGGRWRAVPQAEGQQRARLLVEFKMDTLQLTRSDQLVWNDGRRALAFQAVLSTPKKETAKTRERWKEDAREEV